MAYAKGFAATAGSKVASVWNTEVLVDAGYGLEFTSESLTPDSQFIPDMEISGSATTQFGDKGNEFHSGNFVMDGKYQGVEHLIAQAFGTAGTPSQVATDDAYKHVFKLNKNKEGLFSTVVIDKIVEVWEYPTCKVASFSLSVAPGQRAKYQFSLIPGSLNINTSTGTNKTSTVSGMTLPSVREFLKFSQLAIRVNAQSGGALANSDLIYPSEFNLQINNNYPTDDVTTKYGYRVDEPVQNGFTEITGTVGFSKYYDGSNANNTFLAGMIAKTRYKMDAVFTGPIADGSTPFSMSLFFPDVQFVSGTANVGGPQRVPLQLQFKASRVSTAPTGFTAGYVDGVVMELVNQNPVNALV